MSVIRPHKAETADLEKLTFPAIAQAKIDGVRGIKILPSFTSRELKPFRNQTLTHVLSNPLLTGMDGELCIGEITNPYGELCRRTTSFVNSYWTQPLPDNFTWNVFDYITPETYFMSYDKRLAILHEVVHKVKQEAQGKLDFLRVVNWAVVHSLEEFLETHAFLLEQGYEGTIYRKPSAPHKNGRSTVNQSYFMRLKDFADEEGTIIGFNEAQENLNSAEINPLGYTERSSAKAGKIGKGMIGSIIVRTAEGEEVLCGPGSLTHEERIQYFHEPFNFIGRTCTFLFMPYGQYKKRRFPRFKCFRAEED